MITYHLQRGTHYVVLAYRCTFSDQTPLRPDDQHSAMRWWEISELLASPECA